ncbi:hypothetical protein GCM10027299_29720 [Larkinella ripae]
MQAPSAIASPQKSTAYQWDQVLSFVATVELVGVHYHNCYKIVVALNGTIDCELNGDALPGLRGYVANQKTPHTCSSFNTDVIVYFIDPNSSWGKQLKTFLGGKPFLDLGTVLTDAQLDAVLPSDYNARTAPELTPFGQAFLETILAAQQKPETALDQRIEAALDRIDQNLHQPWNLDDLANLLNLSPERSRHLFARQTGSPFTQYIIWKRIRQILALATTSDVTLAEACVQLGFTDQPHFNQRFKRIFGIPPKYLLRDCKFL